jgi:CHASE2 domain-containing sensor protein
MTAMKSQGDGGAYRAFAAVAVALAGLLFGLTPPAERLDGALLDLQWSLLRRADPRPAPDDIVIVAIDAASVARIREPVGLWHEPLGRALVRIASARPRAIGLEFALPERSQDAVRAGLDRALLVGLAAARQNGPLVASLSIDARSRGARPIFPPYLAILRDEGLGIGLLARDADGVTRRFSTLIPTEDGGFPTLAGRLCRALQRRCDDGYIHFALGAPFRAIPLHEVLQATDAAWLEAAFRDRIVLIGETPEVAGRVAVPINYAGWERAARDSPAVVVHAQALRTAMLGAAPEDASRAVMLVLVTLCALAFLLRSAAATALAAALLAIVLLAAGVLALRGGVVLPLGAAVFTLAIAAVARIAAAAARTFTIRRR